VYNYLMEVILLFAVVLLQFGYIVYKDQSFRKDRERMELKILCKDMGEYKALVEDDVKESGKSATPKEDEVIDIYDATVEQILKAREL